ncbi:hypothetical protein BOW53_03460 [Solemya pervernicosa gill symbiont]|uniref:Uncharacterized protein n=2 Tax=Gammaproteobacteria incertae sedis TaxID=118884 RepID=A0A1T2L8Z8_9GAMM|nr:tetratricopeptide repeat protein [Candidatus Reidiella endopervernicosa]OOZ41579.1 hypothetical protein BOW53_03460 [Solemya pervernicosa gill symbiont]QKQ27984.1 tetratricopeptide repeat protein [Candidatus Reidiella endopervernicosa]
MESTASAHERATALLSAGLLDDAESLWLKILHEYPNATDAQHGLGTIALQRGDLERAIELLESATSAPQENAQHLKDLGNAYASAGKGEAAENAFRTAINVDPDFFAAHANLGNSLLARGEPEQAITCYQTAISLRPEIPQLHDNLGTALRSKGDLRAAAEAYQKALDIAPTLLTARINLGNVLIDQKQYQRAITLFSDISEQHPNIPDAFVGLGIAQMWLDQFEAALTAFNHAVKLNPRLIDIHFKLGQIYNALHRLPEAKKALIRAIELNASHLGAQRLMATLLRREGNIEQALSLLNQIDIRNNLGEEAGSIHFELGMLYDRAQESAKAFHHFSAGNNIRSAEINDGSVQKERYLNQLKQLHQQFSPEWFGQWHQTSITDQLPCPVFIVGFPRSGTTLLDQILNSHPNLRVMEEQPVIASLMGLVNEQGGGYPGGLASISDELLETLRRDYFNLASERVKLKPGEQLVDKLPLNTIRIGAIHRLFPDAKIILSLRHPYDVCLSNFMQDYHLNDAMANFQTIEDCAKLYSTVMSLWQQYETTLPLNVHKLPYESLVDNLETSSREVIDFLGLEWDPTLLDYASHARDRGFIKTPSYLQVSEPIYQRAKYRWRRYINELEPVIEQLAPYASHFGYPTE